VQSRQLPYTKAQTIIRIKLKAIGPVIIITIPNPSCPPENDSNTPQPMHLTPHINKPLAHL